MIDTHGYAAFDARSPLRPFSFARRDPGPRDVVLDILYCGICHSDLHQVRDEWGGSTFPLVPGHEIVGRVARVGAEVSKFKPGDTAGVGCMVGSCGRCAACKRGLEQYCEQGPILTYNGVDAAGERTQGGYSTRIVVDEKFVLQIGAKDRLDAIAPLLCAGITTWSPLRHWEIGKGQRVAVNGLGGLGHMAVKLAHALGAEVALISTSPAKRADAQRLGADDFLVSRDDAQLAKAAGRFDLILDTVSAPHDLAALSRLLRLDGTLVLLGVPPEPFELGAFELIGKRRSIAGSAIGGIAETQEMLDFCAKNGIVADVETIPMQDVNRAYERMLKSDVRYRFSIDLASLR
jgi:alcohol dehydrogenase (NADP+)